MESRQIIMINTKFGKNKTELKKLQKMNVRHGALMYYYVFLTVSIKTEFRKNLTEKIEFRKNQNRKNGIQKNSNRMEF